MRRSDRSTSSRRRKSPGGSRTCPARARIFASASSRWGKRRHFVKLEPIDNASPYPMSARSNIRPATSNNLVDPKQSVHTALAQRVVLSVLTLRASWRAQFGKKTIHPAAAKARPKINPHPPQSAPEPRPSRAIAGAAAPPAPETPRTADQPTAAC